MEFMRPKDHPATVAWDPSWEGKRIKILTRKPIARVAFSVCIFRGECNSNWPTRMDNPIQLDCYPSTVNLAQGGGPHTYPVTAEWVTLYQWSIFIGHYRKWEKFSSSSPLWCALKWLDNCSYPIRALTQCALTIYVLVQPCPVQLICSITLDMSVTSFP